MAFERDPVERTYILLLLAAPNDDREVPFDAIKTWTPDERLQAEEYAIAVYLRASDNDNVKVPDMPDVVKPYFMKD